MKYVITGGAGHISKPLASTLLEAGHTVTVIGRNAANLESLVAKGAHAAIGSVEDVNFLTNAFAGADAVYVMCPPNYITSDVKGFYELVGKNYTQAIQANKSIRYVVHLSSIGAHLPAGTGPVVGLYRSEQVLNTLTGVHIKHLRPAYFYYNLYSNLDLVKHMGITGSNFSIPAGKFPIVDPSDIADVATEVLLNLDFTGHSVRYISSDEIGTADIATALGKAIGKPDLKWVTFTDEQAYGGMLQAGLSAEIARNFVEMGDALNTGTLLEEYWKDRPATLGKVKLDDFAKSFAAAYKAS